MLAARAALLEVATGSPWRPPWHGEAAAPALLKRLEDLEVSIRKNDCQALVESPALQIPRDIDAAFPIEKTGRIGNFIGGHLSRTVIGDKEA